MELEEKKPKPKTPPKEEPKTVTITVRDPNTGELKTGEEKDHA